jgi:hypothetical protein
MSSSGASMIVPARYGPMEWRRGPRGARRGGEPAMAHKGRAERRKDAAGNNGPSVGRAARRRQDNSSQWVGEEPFRRREAEEWGERVEEAPEQRVL